MPSGKKRKRHKVATHKRKKRARANRHKKKQCWGLHFKYPKFFEINYNESYIIIEKCLTFLPQSRNNTYNSEKRIDYKVKFKCC